MVWFFALTSILFVSLAAYFAFRFERKIKESKEQEKDIQRKIYELNLLSEITEKIGYSLSIESIAKTIALTVEDLFDLSTVSYAIIEPGQIIRIRTFIKEEITSGYLNQVSKIILNSMFSLDQNLENHQIVETKDKDVLKVYINRQIDMVPSSYFNIPLVVGNQFRGMINISSRKKGIYQDQDMSLLYKIVNKAQRAVGMLDDVMETEKAKLDSMILSLPTGAILFGFEKGSFNLSLINQSAKNFLGIRQDSSIAEVLSKFPQDLVLVEKIKSVIAEKKSLILREVKISNKTFIIYITPIFSHSGQKIIGVSLLMRDLSLEKKLEKVRSAFTNMVVHELQAPLTAIRGASSLLLSSTLSENEEEKMMHVISDSARDMLGAILELLDVAKVEEGKFVIRKVKADLASLVGEHLEVFSYAAQEKGIAVSFAVDRPLPEFYFDPGRIGQVINNLVSNSLKFTREGGKVEIKIQAKEAEILVSVIDNGIGIPENKKAILFTKFGQIGHVEQAEPYASQASTGLGLFISREIIESHGGKIWIESEGGKGTKVFFTLPLILDEERKDEVISREFAN